MLNNRKIQDKKLCWDIMANFYRKLRYIGQVQSDFSYAKDVRIFNMSDYLKTKHERINDSAHKLFIAHKKRWFSFEIKSHIISFVEFLIQYIALIGALLYNGLELGDFIFYILVINNFSNSVISLFNNYSEINYKSIEIDDFRAFMQEGLDKDAVSNNHFKPIPKSNKYKIEFKNVSFKYS